MDNARYLIRHVLIPTHVRDVLPRASIKPSYAYVLRQRADSDVMQNSGDDYESAELAENEWHP